MSFIVDTIAIVGPTAIGKTAVGIALAEALGGAAEIVSLDSMQVYRYLDIGTAKPSADERAATPFSMIDIVDPDDEFTLADFQRLGAGEKERIAGLGSVALLVGGTGLYFRALTTRLDIPQTPPDPAFRAHWQGVVEAEGLGAVRERLIAVDPAAAEKIHPNDARRMIRALEVFEKTGKPLSEWHRENREAGLAETTDERYFCLDCDRNELYAAIERRVDLMIEAGLIDEVESLRTRGYGRDLKPMQSLGYRQVNDYLDGLISRDDAVLAIKAETRHFARRQLIWFRADKRLTWLDTNGQTATQVANQIFASVKN